MPNWGKIGNVKGPQGDSAYTVATKNGFVGTVQQWLASLKGQDGANVTDAQVASATSTYIAAHPPAAGADGKSVLSGNGAPPGNLDATITTWIDADTGDLYTR